MKLTDFHVSLLTMLEKFGPALSSSAVIKRESALQELVKCGCATMTRSAAGQMSYVITREGCKYLESKVS